MSDGTQYEGRIVKSTDDAVVIKNNIGMELTLDKAKIHSHIAKQSDDATVEPAPTSSEVKITKLATIHQEIIDTEYKMDQAAELIYGGPIAAGLVDAGIAYLIVPTDSNAFQGIRIAEYAVALVGIIISGKGLLQYWDGVNTAGQLRAKKYDLMFCPYLNPEKLANSTTGALGLTINLKI